MNLCYKILCLKIISTKKSKFLKILHLYANPASGIDPD
jgi:hypothetical protein